MCVCACMISQSPFSPQHNQHHREDSVHLDGSPAADAAATFRAKISALSADVDRLKAREEALLMELQSRPSMSAFRQTSDRVKELERALSIRVPVSC